MDGYTGHDRRRRHAESPKQSALSGAESDGRSAFSRDRARVLHSAALRRLAGKTQVVGPGEGAEISGIPRTRLTHSLEVAQIGRAIAEELGADPDLVDTAGLAHDIGHPPFGHNGEAALDSAARGIGGFEGNAQTLRILTRLEPKASDGIEASGLNLTRAGLDATMKYPWPREGEMAKFGVYADDLDVFTWVRDRAPAGQPCLEAQIMDWADDVAYSVHDVEDGILAGRIRMGVLHDDDELRAVAELAARRFSDHSVSYVQEVARELLTLPVLATLIEHEHERSPAVQIALKRLTSELVGRFVTAAVTGTRERYGPGPLSRYRAQLTVPEQVRAEVALLKSLALRYVLDDSSRRVLQQRERQLLTDLVELLPQRSPEALDPIFHPRWNTATDDADRLRVVLDQIAVLTDAQAHSWHRRHRPGHRRSAAR